MKIGCSTLLVTLLLLVLLAFATAGTAFAADPVSLSLDGAPVVFDPNAPPVIEASRTLVPYRALLEAMGAKVLWDQEAMMATAILGSRQVQVNIDSTVGFVNGVSKTMDVPPRIVNGRTMIPLRFVLENLNCEVEWQQATRTVAITTARSAETPRVTAISTEETKTSYRVVAQADQPLGSTGTFAYENPERYGIDLRNAQLPAGVGRIDSGNEVFSAVRFSQFDSSTVRIVVDLNSKTAGKVSLSEDRTALYIDFDKPGMEAEPEPEPADPVDRGDATGREPRIPALDWRAAGKRIVVDVGHGGKDPGAEGKLDGVHAIWEKDLNLAVALRLREIMEEAGANIILLRDTDAPMTLYARPEAANTMNADLLVSIHNNSAETAVPKGTEVHYYAKEWEQGYEISSRDLAKAIQAEMVAEVGFYDRGTYNSPALAVLNKSLMPAVIIEGGYLSNPEDLAFMMTDDYVEAYATAVARGLIQALNAAAAAND